MAQEMQNGMGKDTVKKMDQNDKLDVIIDYLFSIDERTGNIEQSRQDDVEDRKEHCQLQYERCDTRFKKIEKLYYGVIAVLLVANVVLPPTLLTLWG